MFVADGGKSVEKLLGMTGEPYRPEMQQYKEAKELGVYDMWKLHTERSELQRQYLEQWMSMDIDAILGKLSLCDDLMSDTDIEQRPRLPTPVWRTVTSSTLDTLACTMSWTILLCRSHVKYPLTRPSISVWMTTSH